MFDRKIEKELLEWKGRARRKPLILRGARQTGKTTLIKKIAGQFKNLIELNLEKDAARKLFSSVKETGDVIRSIEGLTNQRVVPGDTLLFIDEIQNSVPAIKFLRYFHEDLPDLHVISAGSLLEVRMKSEGWSFPVGRVEFLYLYPVSFDEFLSALGEDILLGMICGQGTEKGLPPAVHDKLVGLVATYMTVGGMPEAVEEYIESHSFMGVRRCHEALASSFKEDFAKYSKESEAELLKIIWDRIPFEIGARVKYSRLTDSQARSRDVSRAFDVLHEAMIVERIFPTTCSTAPLVKKDKAAPKVLHLDIGLCTSALNLVRDHIFGDILSSSYSGGLLEGLAGQELLALNFRNRTTPFFWIREEKDASSELDYLMQIGERIVPIEVKAASHGSLKSLHQFLHRSRTDFGVRIYSGPLKVEKHSVVLPDGKSLKYTLLSVPFYSVSRLVEICTSCMCM